MSTAVSDTFLLRKDLTFALSGINVYYVWIKRKTITSVLGSSAQGLNANLYFRLLMLSGIDLLITIPFNIWCLTTWFPIYPWIGWTVLHYDFSRIDKYPATLWQGDLKIRLMIEGDRWISVVYALIFFSFFGFTVEAKSHYTSALQFFAKKVGYKIGSSSYSGYVIALTLLLVGPKDIWNWCSSLFIQTSSLRMSQFTTRGSEEPLPRIPRC